ncbi:hypothetical protein MWU57_02865 [Isoptericola sp. S6320L]|uniref:hypothetical protein n=1 Tax=Isoptericola sp. S6320L TaxID=2926411 RepID=UPI001FF19BBA|nr:hypothetical protein [Isoptericola sp. S6320L]MCK0115963.1 hypothetical protein [Isoptericola sp. S6320L]
MNRSRALLPIALVAATATLAACTGEASASGEDGEVIRVATQRQPHLYAPYVYSDHAEGVTIEVVPMANSTDELNAVLTGDVDFALSSECPPSSPGSRRARTYSSSRPGPTAAPD